jgi:hypothetical protein
MIGNKLPDGSSHISYRSPPHRAWWVVLPTEPERKRKLVSAARAARTGAPHVLTEQLGSALRELYAEAIPSDLPAEMICFLEALEGRLTSTHSPAL